MFKEIINLSESISYFKATQIGVFLQVIIDLWNSKHSRDFSTEENQKSALKNAYVALSKQQFNKAICFLLLANKPSDALQVCVKVNNDYWIIMIRIFMILC